MVAASGLARGEVHHRLPSLLLLYLLKFMPKKFSPYNEDEEQHERGKLKSQFVIETNKKRKHLHHTCALLMEDTKHNHHVCDRSLVGFLNLIVTTFAELGGDAS